MSVMGMVFCRGCAKEIHETATSCPQCGAAQSSVVRAAPTAAPWLGIVSLVLGILSVLAFFDDGEWDRDTMVGLGMFSVAGLVCGIIGINKRSGFGLAIAGTILCSVALLCLLGLAN